MNTQALISLVGPGIVLACFWSHPVAAADPVAPIYESLSPGEKGGRQHWGNGYSYVVADGGFQGGHVVGEMDEDGSEELYDHDADPHEWTNLADKPEFAAVKTELAKSLPTSDAAALGSKKKRKEKQLE